MPEINEAFENAPTEKVKLKKKKVKGTNPIVKAVEYLDKQYDIRLNLDTKQVEIRDKVKKDAKEKEYDVIDDTKYRYLRIELEMEGISLTDDKFRNLIYSGYFFDSYAPFKEYIFGLPKWDGVTDYIADWCKQVNLVDEKKHRKYFIEGFRKWFVAMVVSLVNDIPSRKFINQTCLIFSGKQGAYKSTFMDNLLPEQWRLRYYLAGIYDFHKEEHQKYLGQKVIINLEELAAFNRGDIEAIKTRITQPVVSLRLKWGKEDTFFKRRASFVGTTNDREFLLDLSGTRRFFVIPIERIYIDETLNVAEMYAQALALYKSGFKYWFDETDIDVIEGMNEDFKMAGMEESLVLDYYRKPDKEDYERNAVQYVSATEIAQRLSKIFERLNVNNSVIRNIGKSLSSNGYIQTPRRINGKARKMWNVVSVESPKYESESIENMEELF